MTDQAQTAPEEIAASYFPYLQYKKTIKGANLSRWTPARRPTDSRHPSEIVLVTRYGDCTEANCQKRCDRLNAGDFT
jgi:hypothetical protein